MEIAIGVERAVNDLDDTLCQLQLGVVEDDNDLVDLLIAAMTSVPDTLLQRLYNFELTGDEMDAQQHQYYISSMEEICFNSACISSDIIIKHVIHGDDISNFRQSHVRELVEQVIFLCEEEGVGMDILCPIIELLNAAVDQRQMRRALFDQGCVGQDIEDTDPPSLFDMCAKDTLRLIQMLLRPMDSEMSTFQSRYFASHLMVHFADMVLVESGHSSFGECQDLFRVWANGTDKLTARRLTKNDIRVTLDSILQFQVDNTQAALQLLERTDEMMAAFTSSEDMDDDADSDDSDDCIATVQDIIRRVSMLVTVTEVMDSLGIQSDPEMNVYFHPFMVNFADFVALGLHEAFVSRLIDLGQEGQALSHLADDLLVRMCHTSNGTEFLRNCDDARRGDVFTVAILRALSSGCIFGKGKFLLEMASNLAQEVEDNPNSEPSAKKQCSGNFDVKPLLGNTTSSTKAAHDMAEMIMLCMTLSQCNCDEGVDRTSIDQTAWIASLLMSPDQNAKHQVLDPLNPWHTFNANFMEELTPKPETDSQDERSNDTDSLYSSAMPSCLDTSSTACLSI